VRALAVAAAALAALAGCVTTGDVLGPERLPRVAEVADDVLRGWGAAPPDELVAPGDVDGDGRADLVAFRAGDSTLTIVGASRRTVAFPSAITVSGAGDLDGDGRADLAIGLPLLCEVRVLYGGDTDATAAIALAPACENAAATGAGDLDGDGRAELVVAPAAGGPRLFYGRASRAPRSLADADAVLVPAAGDLDVGMRVVAAGDTDGDGRGDVAITAHTATLLYRGERFAGDVAPERVAERFENDTIGPHAPAGLGDLDADGRADLALNGFELLYALYYGRPGAYGTPDAAVVGTDTADRAPSIAGGDGDGDGARDLVIADPGLVIASAATLGGIHFLRGDGARLAGVTDLVTDGETWLGAVTAIAVDDLDGDGADDIAIAVPSDAAVYVVRP
jgi:hypothetical protein